MREDDLEQKIANLEATINELQVRAEARIGTIFDVAGVSIPEGALV